MYVNDLISYISQNTTARIIMYADDTVLLTEDKDPEEAVESMKEVLCLTNKWCDDNKLTINAKKTKHMLVLRNKELSDETSSLEVSIAGATLANVTSYKYLGIDVDRNLSYEESVHNTYVKANKKLFTMRKIRPYITQKVAALIYKQFVLPILDYADFLLESAPKREIDLLDRIQKRA